MKKNYNQLTKSLQDLLTKEDLEKGYVFITYNVDISTQLFTDSDMVDEILKRSPYRDHIIGFQRVNGHLSIKLDEEGQKKWDKEYQRIAEFYRV